MTFIKLTDEMSEKISDRLQSLAENVEIEGFESWEDWGDGEKEIVLCITNGSGGEVVISGPRLVCGSSFNDWGSQYVNEEEYKEFVGE